jgi:transglutaminase-like putative cysteine protease
MDRRHFLRAAGAVPAGLFPLLAAIPPSEQWRTFEVTTTVEVLKPSGETRLWLPAALTGKVPFQRTLSNEIHAQGGEASLLHNGRMADCAAIVMAKFPPGIKPVLTLTSRVATKNYSVNLSAPSPAPPLSPAEREYFLRPTKLIPTNGIVRQTALDITRAATTDLAKARAIYNWIVENTVRDPKTRGCGLGDIRFMLESRDLRGKCADLNSLFVGLARAAGLPARDVFGIRTAQSDLGYKSLGVATQNVTKAQHCRAEVYLQGIGWVPVDPADVRKVMLEEPSMTAAARARLFGSWEMNWIAYNFAHDVVLPGAGGPPLGFFMYPQAQTAEGRLDSLDPAAFRYEITSREKMLPSS